MSECFPDSRLNQLSSRHVQAYAALRGWQRGETFRNCLVIFERGDGSLDQLLVPVNPEFSDFAEMMQRVVQQLAEREARHPASGLDELLLMDCNDVDGSTPHHGGRGSGAL